MLSPDIYLVKVTYPAQHMVKQIYQLYEMGLYSTFGNFGEEFKSLHLLFGIWTAILKFALPSSAVVYGIEHGMY